MPIDRGDQFIPSDGSADFYPSTTTPAEASSSPRSGSPTNRWPTVGVDPDQVLSAALTRAEEMIRERLAEHVKMFHWENTNRVRKVLEANGIDTTDLQLWGDAEGGIVYAAHSIIEAVAEELGLTAGQLRGERLIRRAVLDQVGRLCEELIRREVDSVPGPESAKFGRMVRFLLARHLQAEEGHDQRRARKQASAGGDPNSPPAYRAPTAPHPNAGGV